MATQNGQGTTPDKVKIHRTVGERVFLRNGSNFVVWYVKKLASVDQQHGRLTQYLGGEDVFLCEVWEGEVAFPGGRHHPHGAGQGVEGRPARAVGRGRHPRERPGLRLPPVAGREGLGSDFRFAYVPARMIRLGRKGFLGQSNARNHGNGVTT